MKIEAVISEALAHYGVLGMKWGRRSATPTVSVTQKGKKLKTSGGEGRKASSDAIRTAKIAQTKKKSGIKALSDQELNAYANRLQLEQRVKGLEYSQKSAPKKFIANLLGTAGKQAAQQAANETATKAVKRTMAKRVVKTAASAA